MFASIIIVLLALLFGSLSIIAQYTKDQTRREKLARVVSIPAGLALYGSISWLMRNAHHLDELHVSSFTLFLALAFFVLIPAATFIFSPAFKDAGTDPRQPLVSSQNNTTQAAARSVPFPQRPDISVNPCRSVVAVYTDDTFIIEGIVVDDEDVYPKLLEASHS